ncbi:MAG: KAP family NTPase [Oscillospiraceae bacterium]|nr:KAP family NTPase [Oscillospiraceae bacterium]
MTKGFADKAQKFDSLGMDDKYEGIARFMTCCETPMTIAINGDWGSGKSSAMNIIQEKLKKKYDFGDKSGIDIESLIINFNTWEFSIFGENDKLVLELMKTLNDRLDRICSKENIDSRKINIEGIKSALMYLLKKVPSGVVRMGVDMFEDLDGVKSIISMVNGMARGGENNDIPADTAAALSCSNTDIARAVKENIDKKIKLILENIDSRLPKRLYIFIDDLDRLEPRVALELIEGMKNFVTYENCVFVLAVDQKVIERGLKSKYGNDFNDEMTTNFFDKIIQVPFKLPTDRYDIKEYIYTLFTGKNGADSSEGSPEASMLEEQADKFAKLLYTFGENNPRTIKRSLNLLQLYRCFSDNDGNPESDIPDIKAYSIRLLMLKSESSYQMFLNVAKIYDPKDDGQCLKAMADFKELEEMTDDESSGEETNAAGYRSAVLNTFYSDISDQYEQIEATRMLISILNITAPEAPEANDKFTKAGIVNRLYKATVSGGYTMTGKLNGNQPFDIGGSISSLLKCSGKIFAAADYGDTQSLEIHWDTASQSSKNFYIIIDLKNDSQVIEYMESVKDENNAPVFKKYNAGELSLPENINNYFYIKNEKRDNIGVYMNTHKNLKYIFNILRNAGINILP